VLRLTAEHEVTMPSQDTIYTSADRQGVTLRRATAADHEALATLLGGAGLPLDGFALCLDRFWVAEDSARVIGAAGMEHYGDSGLLRSVAVAPEWRSSGIGRALVERVLEDGRAAGIREIYLLTTTAERYFPRLGFACVGRETVPAALQLSAEFTGACPDSAVVMRKIFAG
jgi:amino-acid N-acetyltransferase